MIGILSDKSVIKKKINYCYPSVPLNLSWFYNKLRMKQCKISMFYRVSLNEGYNHTFQIGFSYGNKIFIAAKCIYLYFQKHFMNVTVITL